MNENKKQIDQIEIDMNENKIAVDEIEKRVSKLEESRIFPFYLF